MTYLYYLQNETSCQLHRQVPDHKLLTIPELLTICVNQSELLTSECHPLSINTCSDYMQKPTFHDIYMTYCPISIKTIIQNIHCSLSLKPFSSPIIRVPLVVQVICQVAMTYISRQLYEKTEIQQQNMTYMASKFEEKYKCS